MITFVLFVTHILVFLLGMGFMYLILAGWGNPKNGKKG